ncbi:hypothetical protein ACQ3I4_15960 [Zafaria sp. Z1313]|uniref:hypothetical protein n=1 Tax=unclassified Zafaria TaxID=2828765 RepID=UPI002E770CCD|nr:hypothetical protein [Zafaria sp. J156]MEE1622793.1 hypothetical protein [Zafaria sp. J156]
MQIRHAVFASVASVGLVAAGWLGGTALQPAGTTPGPGPSSSVAVGAPSEWSPLRPVEPGALRSGTAVQLLSSAPPRVPGEREPVEGNAA